MATILVAYATKYGSTREVAEAIGQTLAEKGFDVDVRPAADIRDMSPYSAVVLGTALYYFMLRPDARRFLRRHRRKLPELPTALFALGPFNDTEDEMTDARKPIDRYLERNAWLKPVSVRIFGGKFDPKVLRFPENNPAMKKMPPSDARNWDDIKHWAAELPDLFRTM